MSFYLPPLCTFESVHNNKYSVYTDVGVNFPVIRANGGSLFSKLASFTVIQSNTVFGAVHIRCQHNRKFLRRKSVTASEICPDGDEINEDPSSWTCTLFKPEVVDIAAGTFKMLHVYTGLRLYTSQYISIWNVRTETDDLAPQFLFTAVDLESLIILPRHVAFKGSNGKYLKAHMHSDGKRYLVFNSDDKAHRDSWFEVFTTLDQRIHVLTHYGQTLWTHTVGDAWIYSNQANNGDVTAGTRFYPQKVTGSTVAIRAESLFFEAVTNGVGPCLKATSPNIAASSRLGVEELVLERRIYNADFDLANAVVYGQTPIGMATASGTNDTDEPNSMELKFIYTDSKSSTWTSSHSWMVGVTVTAEFKIPFIGGGGSVEATSEYSESYEWGETLTTEKSIETTYTVVVPPQSTVSLTLMATHGKCDVNYTFYQRDKLYDGTSVTFYKEDGVYTGINAFNFQYEATTTTRGRSGEETTTVEIIPIPNPNEATSITTTQQLDVSAPRQEVAEDALLPLEVTTQEI